jgi:hypothetical protein
VGRHDDTDDGTGVVGGRPGGQAPRRPRSAFWTDLHAVLAERNFRHLFATRLISQAGDGVFTAGVGTYVFFNAETFPGSAAGAAAFAVLYLPYSLIGPFVPANGHSPALIALVAAGYAVVAAGYWLAWGRDQSSSSSPPDRGAGPVMPSPAAQRSSS